MSFTVVSRDSLGEVVSLLGGNRLLSCDLETTGLYPHHSDRLFSIAIATEDQEFYFNFLKREDIPENFTLPIEALFELSSVFENPDISWFLHNAKFDMAFLQREGFTLAGKIYCTKVGARLIENYEQDLSLAGCGARIGVEKDGTLDLWFRASGAYKKECINETIIKKKDYTQVPFDLIVKYACQDARVCYNLGVHQFYVMEKWEKEAPQIPRVREVCENEASLTKALFRMETRGVLIDRQYCLKSLALTSAGMQECVEKFKESCGKDFILSNKVFQEVFLPDKDKWEYTKKNNPSFVNDVLANFSSEAAQYVTRYRDLKSRHDFFSKFLFFADSEGAIHTSFNSAEGRTGRFSSSDPNLQNLKRPDDDVTKDPLDVRSAFIPRPGFCFVMMDYSQLEYRVMLDQAEARKLIDQVKSGLDVHEATAKLSGATRQQSKTVNFLTLYGGGVKLLAENLGVSEDRAREIRNSIFRASPEIKDFMSAVTKKAESRGWVFNWAGRRYYFPEKNKCYKATNYLIQGGCADLIKKVMVRIDTLLAGLRSQMILTIHDEIVFEMHPDDFSLLPRIKEIMETTYPYKRLPLVVSVEHSYENLSKTIEGFPTMVQSARGAEESRDAFQGQDQTAFSFTPEYLVREDSAGNAKRNS